MHNTTTNNIAHFSSELEGRGGRNSSTKSILLATLFERMGSARTLWNLETLHTGQTNFLNNGLLSNSKGQQPDFWSTVHCLNLGNLVEPLIRPDLSC